MLKRRLASIVVFVVSEFLASAYVTASPLSPGDIVIADVANTCVLQYGPNGVLKDTIAVAEAPVGVSVTPQGNILVTSFTGSGSSVTSRISTYSSTGSLLNTSTSPSDHAVIFGLSQASDGTLIAAAGNSTIWRHNASLNTWTSYIAAFSPASGDETMGVDAAPTGGWWVTDHGSKHFSKFGSNGVLLGVYATLNTPGGIAVSPTDGSIWIAEANGTSGYVRHYNQNTSALMGSFPIDTASTVVSIDFALDGSIYVGDMNGSAVPGKHVSQYSTAGTLLSSFSLPLDSSPQFLAVAPSSVPEPGIIAAVAGVSLFLVRRPGRTGKGRQR